MLKIAHVASDEKFIETAVDIFESVFPKQNVFYITTPKPWHYLSDNEIYKEVSSDKFIFLLKLNEFVKYDLIIFHGLPNEWLLPIALFKNKYIWIGWGFDYYNRFYDEELLSTPLLLPKTRTYYNEKSKSEVRESKIKNLVSGFARKVKKHLIKNVIYPMAMRNIKVFSPVLADEFKLVQQKHGVGKKTRYLPWNYGSLERHLLKNIKLDGIDKANSILLGNSATATNNHIEILDFLSNLETKKTLYIPLSYGSPAYAKSISNYINCNSQLASSCYVLDRFMPLSDYNSIINKCGFVIMNHVRQQALGNIVIMMFRGSKIFLREESVLYNFFKEQSAYVFSVQELENNPTLLDFPLTDEQIEYNRLILKRTWSESVIYKRTKDLVLSVLS